jgi:hypothetical protein
LAAVHPSLRESGSDRSNPVLTDRIASSAKRPPRNDATWFLFGDHAAVNYDGNFPTHFAHDKNSAGIRKKEIFNMSDSENQTPDLTPEQRIQSAVSVINGILKHVRPLETLLPANDPRSDLEYYLRRQNNAVTNVELLTVVRVILERYVLDSETTDRELREAFAHGAEAPRAGINRMLDAEDNITAIVRRLDLDLQESRPLRVTAEELSSLVAMRPSAKNPESKGPSVDL